MITLHYYGEWPVPLIMQLHYSYDSFRMSQYFLVISRMTLLRDVGWGNFLHTVWTTMNGLGIICHCLFKFGSFVWNLHRKILQFSSFRKALWILYNIFELKKINSTFPVLTANWQQSGKYFLPIILLPSFYYPYVL